MVRQEQRSRSPRRLATALSSDAQEAWLSDLARVYWLPSDNSQTPPWDGERAVQVMLFREKLVAQVEDAADWDMSQEEDDNLQAVRLQLCFPACSKETVVRWQRFAFFEDLACMSDVLFRGPIDPRHSSDIQFRLHDAWRRLRLLVDDTQEFAASTADFRVSAARVTMMLETARPPEASQLDELFELPDARTLASLLSMRCQKDDVDELLELYRLICQKLQGSPCTWCNEPFDEGSSVGLFDGPDSLVIPATIPKVIVPQCGHAIHTLCFGSQLVPDHNNQQRGYCRRCGLNYAWTSIDVDPLVNAFCLMFGTYVDKCTTEMRAAGEVSDTAVLGIAEVCQAFALELGGLVSPASAWSLLARRRTFADPEMVDIVGDAVQELLIPAETEERGQRASVLNKTAIVCPEDKDDLDIEDVAEHERHVTDIFLPSPAREESDVSAEEDGLEASALPTEFHEGPPLPSSVPGFVA